MTALELGVLPIGDVDPDTSSAPSVDAVVEVGNVFGVAAEIEGPQCFKGRKVDMSANGGFAVGLKEVASPGFVVLEVHEQPWHGGILANAAREKVQR